MHPGVYIHDENCIRANMHNFIVTKFEWHYCVKYNRIFVYICNNQIMCSPLNEVKRFYMKAYIVYMTKGK